MLTHSCDVEAYADWGVYEPARPLQCFVAEKLASAGPAGTERIAQVTVICRLTDDVPAGSRITLADGLRGYAHAVVRHDGGGLPTPDHLEIAMTLAGAYGPAFGETVAVIYRATGRDGAGGLLYRWTRQEIVGAAVRILASSESALGTAATATDSVEVILPPGTPVSNRDRLEVRGVLYDVDGTPTEVTDPQTTARPGVRVIGKRRDSA